MGLALGGEGYFYSGLLLNGLGLYFWSWSWICENKDCYWFDGVGVLLKSDYLE